MLSRWYSLFLGFLLIVTGIGGLVAASRMHVSHSALTTGSIIWLLIAIISLYVGFGVRALPTVRWWAGMIGAILFVWGIITLIAAPALMATGVMAAVASFGGFMVLLGSLGLASALTSGLWMPTPMVTSSPA